MALTGQLDWEGVVFPMNEVTWDNVLATAHHLEGLEINEDFYVTYTDEEGDHISVKNAKDLDEAIRWAREQGVPCLCLHVPFVSAESESDDESWTEVDGSPRSQRPTVLAPIADAFQLNSNREEPTEDVASAEEEPDVLQAEPAVETEQQEPEEEDTPPVDALEPLDKQEVHLVTPIPEVIQEMIRAQEPVPPVEEEPRADEPVVRDVDVSPPPPQQLRRDTLLRVLLAASEPAKEPTVDDKTLLAQLCANEDALRHLMAFLSHESIQKGIVAVAQAETSAPGSALETAATGLYSSVEAHSELLGHLNHIPNVAQVLTQGLRRLKGTVEASKPSQPPAPVVARPIHTHVMCDGCDNNPALKEASTQAGCCNQRGEIVGARYKSAVLHDFDLCEQCEATGRFQDRAGPFLKIVDPATAPDMILCVLPGASAGMAAQLDSLDWRNPVAREFLEFVQSRRQRAFPQQRAGPPPPPPPRAPAAAAEKKETPQAREAVPQVQPEVPPPPPAPPAVEPQSRCQHTLKRFDTPHAHFTCDICMRKQSTRAVMHGCRLCNFDVCAECASKNSFNLEAPPAPAVTQETTPAPTPAPAATEAPAAPAAPTLMTEPSPPKAKFVSDVTLADGCVVRPGEQLIKTWRVRNTGTEPWPAGTRIGHVGQDALGGPLGGVEVPLAGPGEAVNVSVPLVMPTQPGRYTSFWRMLTPHPQNSQFGHRFWVTVNVVAPPASPSRPMAFPGTVLRPPPPPPPPSAPPASPPSPSAPSMFAQEALTPELETAVAQMIEMFGVEELDKIVQVVKEVNGDTSAAIDKLLEGTDL